MAFLDGVNTIVSIAVGIAGIVGFVLTMVDRRGGSRTSRRRAGPVEQPVTGAADKPADRSRRRASGVRRLLLTPMVFLAAFLGAGLLAALFDSRDDAVDLSAIVGWSVASSVTLAWVYFAVRASRASASTREPTQER